MKLLILLFISLSLASCSTKKVKPEDLDSWKGQPVSVLEKHQFFSTLPREERSIPESSEKIVNFSQKRTVETSSRSCVGTGFGFSNVGLGSNFCSPAEYEERSCVHQFLITNNKVIDYRVLGQDCFTECQMRPGSQCPKK